MVIQYRNALTVVEPEFDVAPMKQMMGGNEMDIVKCLHLDHQ